MKRRRLLLIAIALSLLVHFLVALILRPTTPTPQNQAEVVSIEHRPATIAVSKIPPSPPPPRPTPAPRVVAPAPPKARTGPGTGRASAGGSVVPTPAPPVPTPSPIATASAGCTQPNAEAAVLASPQPPDIAPEARTAAINGTALVKVDLDLSGQVTSASVTQSTGNSSLDLVAVSMARDTRYTPALHDCKPIAGAYTFSVKFVAW
jgi:periplasmic protein TonB